MPTMYVKSGEHYRPALPDEVITAANDHRAARLCGTAMLNNPSQAKDFMVNCLASRQHEVFAVLFLDSRHHVIAFEELFRGTVDSASVHPREVVKRVLEHNASAVIFAHNHPSCDSDPSQADRHITTALKSALQLIQVRVIDHLVVGNWRMSNATCPAVADVASFAEQGLL